MKPFWEQETKQRTKQTQVPPVLMLTFLLSLQTRNKVNDLVVYKIRRETKKEGTEKVP